MGSKTEYNYVKGEPVIHSRTTWRGTKRWKVPTLRAHLIDTSKNKGDYLRGKR